MIPVVTRLVPSREVNDCCVTSIAMYTGHSYEDVLREVVTVDPHARGRRGLVDAKIRKVLRALKTRVRWRTSVDWDDDHGLVRFTDHLALLRNGLIVEGDTLWDVDTWRQNHGYQYGLAVHGIFVAAPE